MIKAGSTAETIDQLPDPSLNQQQPRQQPISPQEQIDEMPSPSPSPDDNISISSNNSIKISDLSKELMKLIQRYDGSDSIVKLFEFIDQFEDFALNTEYTPNIKQQQSIMVMQRSGGVITGTRLRSIIRSESNAGVNYERL